VTPSSRPGVALIAGPTASGKSAIALALAERLPVTIINADASQVYRDLRILSARPSPQEEAHCPHRLFGHIPGNESCSAARWATEAKVAIVETHAAGRLPVLVGGTGLYLRTLLDGIAPIPEIPPEIREHVRRLDVKNAYDCLYVEDPEAAARLNPGDTTRVARALEVVRATGHTMQAWLQHKVGGIADEIALTPLILLPPREWLMERCDARLETMFAHGGVEEGAALLEQQLSPNLPVMRAIGVPQISAFLRGECTREEAVERARLATRQYAKRQYTWFRNQPPAAWPRHFDAINDNILNDLEIKLHNMVLT
jgi:tRNA dimethylallyltransferase